MAIGIDAVYEELRRLQLEGVDRVFIEDATVRLIAPAPKNTPVPARPGPEIDLRAAVAAETTPDTARPAPPKVAAKRTPLVPDQGPILKVPEADRATQLDWLRDQVAACPTCKTHVRSGEKTVFGTGAIDAEILFCGEAPGTEEARCGAPFVGDSGELLDKILSAMGLNRERVYLTHLVKWRPQHEKPYGNRPPNSAEMNFCLPYFKAQIEIIQPKVIVAMGNATISGLLGPDPSLKMATIRGTWQNFEGTDLMVTFHPAYLLRNDTLKTKRLFWEDLLQVMEKVGLDITEKQRGYFLPK